MNAENCLEGRRSIQLSYRGKPQKQKRFNGFPLCFLALNQIKAVASLPSLYAEVCSDTLRSERKSVLQSVLLKLGENRVYFLQLFFRKIKNLSKQSNKHLLYFVDSRHSRHNNTPSGANKGRAKKHRLK